MNTTHNATYTADPIRKAKFSKRIKSIARMSVIGILALCLLSVGCSRDKKTTEENLSTAREHKTVGPNGTINGHDWIDLGLPSGLKWATCNVGASSPEEGGDYFAWGETEPKSEYTTINSLTYKVSLRSLKKSGIIDESGTLTKANDVASVLWGNEWRTPTDDDFKELISECKWTFTSMNEVNGYLVTGPNQKSIFLPASAFQQNTTIENLGEFGDYWSSTIVKELTGVSCSLGYSSKSYGRRRYARYVGRTIRPVTD